MYVRYFKFTERFLQHCHPVVYLNYINVIKKKKIFVFKYSTSTNMHCAYTYGFYRTDPRIRNRDSPLLMINLRF